MTKEEFNSAVQRNSQRLFLIALSYVHTRADAEDMLQNVFMKLWEYKKPFNDSVHIDKWLTCVTVNECKNHLKSPFRKSTDALEIAAEEFTFNDERDFDLFSAVMKLPKKQSVVIHLYYYEDLSVEEIASLLRIKKSAVKTRICRARTQLKQMLGDEWNNE